MSPQPSSTARFLDEIMDMAKAGDSVTLIANQLNRKHGTAITRNAVIGTLYRAGFRKGPAKQRVRMGDMLKHNAQHNLKRPPRRLRPVKRQPDFVIVPVVKPPDPPLVNKPVTLMDLQPQSCRWPVDGDRENTIFCNVKTDRLPYCVDHSKRAYQQRA